MANRERLTGNSLKAAALVMVATCGCGTTTSRPNRSAEIAPPEELWNGGVDSQTSFPRIDGRSLVDSELINLIPRPIALEFLQRQSREISAGRRCDIADEGVRRFAGVQKKFRFENSAAGAIHIERGPRSHPLVFRAIVVVPGTTDCSLISSKIMMVDGCIAYAESNQAPISRTFSVGITSLASLGTNICVIDAGYPRIP